MQTSTAEHSTIQIMPSYEMRPKTVTATTLSQPPVLDRQSSLQDNDHSPTHATLRARQNQGRE
jgi:hypothetical protein